MRGPNSAKSRCTEVTPPPHSERLPVTASTTMKTITLATISAWVTRTGCELSTTRRCPREAVRTHSTHW